LVPSIFGATVPRDSLLNFNEEIPGGLYSSNSGSTDSLITIVAAYKSKHKQKQDKASYLCKV